MKTEKLFWIEAKTSKGWKPVQSARKELESFAGWYYALCIESAKGLKRYLDACGCKPNRIMTGITSTGLPQHIQDAREI